MIAETADNVIELISYAPGGLFYVGCVLIALPEDGSELFPWYVGRIQVAIGSKEGIRSQTFGRIRLLAHARVGGSAARKRVISNAAGLVKEPYVHALYNR